VSRPSATPQVCSIARICSYVEAKHRDDEGDLVRCLDCGTIYSQPVRERDVGACPNCGYVGWIAVRIEQTVSKRAK
jgi:DNA-directed RNA polymerase subunit RPC12/RpoP